MTTTTPPKPRRLICSPLWGAAAGLKPITIDGWENVTLFNYGEGPKPQIKPGTDFSARGPRLHDWEYGRPREVRREWATLLRATKPGDIALGVNTFVNDDRWDDSVGMTANVLKGTGVSLTTEFYIGPKENPWAWQTRWSFRLWNLSEVEDTTQVPSTVCMSAISGRDYASPTVWDSDMLARMMDFLTIPSRPILLFAPASTPTAHAVVEEATRKLAGLIGGVTA